MATQKNLWVLVINLLFMVTTLAGCGSIFGQAQPTPEALQPLNVTSWPTPQPTTPLSLPTPFPEVTLAPTVTPTPSSTPMATSNLLSSDQISPAGSPTPSTTPDGTDGTGLPVVAVAFVTTNSDTIRSGPGGSYPAIGNVKQDDLMAIFGKDSGGDWLYGLTISDLQGWLPAGSVHVNGSLTDAPVLPANPLAALPTSATTGLAQSTKTGSTIESTTMLDNLKPVTTAQVNPVGLHVRQGPGADYKILDTLSQNDRVTVLAVNKPKDWGLVRLAGGEQGWVSLAYLTLNGSLAKAPVVPAAILTSAPGAGLARIQDVAPTPSSSNSPTAPAGEMQSSLATDLVPITTARIKVNKVDVRPGPGTGYAAIDSVTDFQEELSVLALDPTRDWVLVKPAFSHLGWMPLQDLIMQDSLANAPQVITAWVDSNAVELRKGPGIYDDVSGTLAINTMVSVLGLDQTKSWALVKPIMGQGSGWAPIQFLTIDAPLAEIPPAPTPSISDQNFAARSSPVSPPVQSRPVGQSKLVLQLSSGGDIMVINPDGSGLRRLTSGIDPVLSPDGQTVAFTRWQGETGSLWLIDMDGTHERQVVGFIKQAKGPAWSPDGTQIVLNFQHEGRLEPDTKCYPLSRDYSPPRPPQNAYDIGVKMKDRTPELCWTLPPDPHWGLRIINLTDGSFKDLYEGQYAFRPTWDPSQTWRIVADAGDGLMETDTNRDYHHNITDKINDGSPAFSPDGRYLAVTYGQQGGNQGYDIFRMNGDGGGRVRLTQTPLWVPVVPGDFKQWNNVSPTWSPDGSQIAFLTDRTGRWEVWVMNADGSDQHPMFPDEINDQLPLAYHFVDERMISW